MMNKLVFIGGAPGVGKSTVVMELFAQIDRSVWLDGDDVWRMHPFVVNDATMHMVERNIQFVLRSFLKTGFSCIFFTWVLHQDSIVERLLQGLEDQQFEFLHFTLVCDEPTLMKRLSADSRRTTNKDLALDRLRQTESVNSTKICTVGKTPRQIASELKERISA